MLYIGNAPKAVISIGTSNILDDAVTADQIASGAIEAAVTTPFSFRNKIINGKMEIAQRGTSFAAAANIYTLDRWQNPTTSGVVTISQESDAPTGFQKSLRITVTTADTSIGSTDLNGVRQYVEGYNVSDLIGKTFTLSFWVRSSKTGVHCVVIRNFGPSGPDRSYVAEYTVDTADTWEKKSVTVVDGLITDGSWNWTNGIGLHALWVIAAGSALQTTPNAWQSGNFLATANQVNCLDTVGNIFAITGVQLEAGSVATPFEHRPYGVELALCQRYYYRLNAGAAYMTLGVAAPATTTIATVFVYFPVEMRIAPPSLDHTGVATDYELRFGTTSTTLSAVPTFSDGSTKTTALIQANVASGLTVAQAGRFRSATSSAYLGFSAEL